MVRLVGSKTGRIENRAEKSEEKTDFLGVWLERMGR